MSARGKAYSNKHTYDFLHPTIEEKSAVPEGAKYRPQAPYATFKGYEGSPTKAQRYLVILTNCIGPYR